MDTHTLKYYSAITKNEIIPFVATRMDLEIIILSEVEDIYDYHLYVESKNSTNELIYKIETDSQTYKTNLWYQRGRGEGGGVWIN